MRIRPVRLDLPAQHSLIDDDNDDRRRFDRLLHHATTERRTFESEITDRPLATAAERETELESTRALYTQARASDASLYTDARNHFTLTRVSVK